MKEQENPNERPRTESTSASHGDAEPGLHGQTDDDLNRVRDYLEAALGQSPSGIIIADAPDCTIRMANRAAFGVRGGSEELLTGIDVSKHAANWQTFQPDGTPYTSEDLPLSRAILKGETVNGEEVIIRDETGHDHWVLANAAPIHGADGSITAGIVIFTDVSERRKTEEALRESEEKLRAISTSALDGMVMIDGSGAIVYWNPAAERMFGYSAAEVMGKNVHEVIMPSRYSKRQSTGFEAFKATGTGAAVGRVMELTAGRRNGEEFPVELAVSPIRIKGQFWASAIIRDITERKRVEAALRESEGRFRDLAEMLPSAVFEADLQLNLSYANRKAFELFGYSRKEFDSGLNCMQLVVPEERELAIENTRRRVKGEEFGAVEYTCVRSNGSTFPVLLHMTPIKTEDSIIGFRGVIVDITDRKQAEEEKATLEAQLRRAQKLETVGTLAGGIAHDFNNVLAPILGYTDMALQSLEPDNPLAKDLKHVLDAANRAKDLVQQILLFSKQAEQERTPVRPQDIVREALRLLRPSIPSSIEINQRIDDSCRTVRADSTQLHQVVVNLCTNAWQAMRHGGGVLTIEVTEVKVAPALATLHRNLKEAEYVRLSVVDTGPGMNEGTLERVFEPFFTTKAVDEGTGLGLSVVHGIVQGHDGEIVVESKPAEGTTFHVYLPIIPIEPEAAARETTAVAGGSESVLVVDDEPAIADLVATMLSKYGYETEAYYDSAAALDKLRRDCRRYDLVISDLTMPKVNGLELAAAIHGERSNLPVIIMTGFGDNVSAEDRTDSGIDEVVRKPVLAEELASSVRRILDT